MLPLIKAAAVALPAVLALFYRSIVVPPQRWAKHTTGGLIGEVHVKNVYDAHQLAEDVVAEAFSMWEEPSSNWETMHNETDLLLVEVRRITEGPFQKSGILLSRSEGVVKGVSPDEMYNFLTTPKGLQLLDPNMDLDEAAKFIERYDWKGHGKNAHLDIHESFNREVPPGMEERYYIVLNGYDYKNRFFFCKSIVHDSRPGSSPYYEGTPVPTTTDPRVRALNTFYFQMRPTAEGTVLKMVNYADLQMGSTMINWMIGRLFYPEVYKKLNEKWAGGDAPLVTEQS